MRVCMGKEYPDMGTIAKYWQKWEEMLLNFCHDVVEFGTMNICNKDHYGRI